MELKWKFLEDGSLYVEDPVYKKPYILPPHIAGMFQTKEMKRLQKIKQTDYSWIEWPEMKDNKRWRHSMGVAHLGHELFERFSKEIFAEYEIELDEMEQEIAECVLAAHDIGHLDNSHHSEDLIPYSHEARTVDILLGDTQVGRYLRSKYPIDKIEQVVSIISKINNDEPIDNSTLSPLMQMYSQVVSSSYDIDKIDYTLGDSYYAKIPSGVDQEEIIKGFNITVDKNGDLRLVIKEKAQRQGERLQIERFQNYRDIYYCAASVIINNIAPVISQLIVQEPDSVKQQLPSIFLKKMEASVAKKRITTLEEELQMTDDVTDRAYDILKRQAVNPVLRYLCDVKRVRKDCRVFNTDEQSKGFMDELQLIFQDKDLSNTNSLIYSNSFCKLKKPNEDFLIEKENGEVISIEEKTGSVVKPQVFELRRIFFNPELLRLELGLSIEEFRKYKPQIEHLMDRMSGKTEEFQVRYTLLDKKVTKEELIQLLKENGFQFRGSTEGRNIDDYYDTRDFELLSSGSALRGRKSIIEDTQTFSAMYKTPIDGQSKKYTLRNIFETSHGMTDTSLDTVRKAIGEQKISIEESCLLENKPILHADTNRTKMYFVKGNKAICVAWDETNYQNKWLDREADDVMIEVQNKRGTNKLILKTVDQIFSKAPEKFKKCQISKVLRGMKLTCKKREIEEKEESLLDKASIEREKKVRFSEQDRSKLELLLPTIIEQLGFVRKEETYQQTDQTDYYFDTPSLYYGKAKEETSLRTRKKANGRLTSTYKVPTKTSSNMAERAEIEATPEDISAESFLNAMKQKNIKIYPANLTTTTKVENHRKKLTFRGNGLEIELAIDDVMNYYLKTNKAKKSQEGEFEMEIKNAEITVEKQKEILEGLWQDILEKCQLEGIKLTTSKHNKYVSSLIELGILKEQEIQEEYC